MTKQSRKINVAIDGPAGAGKSTVARLVAEALGFIYVDTGAMYRAVTWKALKQGWKPDPGRVKDIVHMAEQIHIQFVPGERGQRVLVNGDDVTAEIRSSEVTKHVSEFACIPEIRRLLVAKQKQWAARKGVVMDGRDIGTQVIPDAEVKVFLTASVEERARRRLQEMAGRDEVTFEQLKAEIAKRDEMDRNRPVSPLAAAEDAVVIDSTNMTLAEVVDAILHMCRTKMDGDT